MKLKTTVFIWLPLALLMVPLSIFITSNGNTINVPESKQPELPTASDAILYNYIKSEKLIGVSAGVLKDNKIIWQNAFGHIDVENGIAADTNMLHRLASVTKPMTAVAIMQLVEQNKLDLDIPIQKYLPNYPIKKEGDLTIRNLLNHTSGTPAYKFFTSENRPTIHYNSLIEAINVFKDRPLTHTPGSEYAYTSYGYTVLGAIIEQVTGMSYQDYMHKNIWSIAGMHHTATEVFGQKYNNQSELYKKGKMGFSKDKVTDLSIKYPAGGVLSTSGDMLRFAKAMHNNLLISEASKLSSFKTPNVEQQLKYGLGWIVEQDKRLGLIHYHDGHQSGTSTNFIMIPSKKMAVIVLANSSKSNTEVHEIARSLMAIHATK